MGGRRSSRPAFNTRPSSLGIVAGLLAFLAVLFLTIGTIFCLTPAQQPSNGQSAHAAAKTTSGPTPAAADAPISASHQPEESTDIPYVDARLNDAIAGNPDTVAWVTIPGTGIDYPVVQAEDNKYYLTHNAQRRDDVAGAIFMDYRNDRSYTYNTILYGHNMKNGSMFKALMDYKNKDFFDEHKVIELSTPSGLTRWEIFSAYVTDTSFYYIQTDFSDNDEWNDFLQKIKGKSIYDTGVALSENDSILTLSTCTYEFNDARFVVHARLSGAGEQ